MPRTSTSQVLTLASAVLIATQSALGQVGTSARRSLRASPPSAVVLGRPVTLSVQSSGKPVRYRFVATMTTTGSGARRGQCVQTQNIGTGTSVTWHPKSGTYRLTAYGPAGQTETDTLTLVYVVRPSSVMLNASQTQAQAGSVTLVLRTSDLGPGHVYEWWMQYRGQSVPTGAGTYGPPPTSQPWTTQTNGPMATYPTPVAPPSSITATVSIHRGDPCEIVAAGAIP